MNKEKQDIKKNNISITLGNLIWYYHHGWRTGTVVHIYSSKTISVNDVMGKRRRVKYHNDKWMSKKDYEISKRIK